MSDRLGVYIHIPFCIKKCNYCDFCSFPSADETAKSAYVEELCRRMEEQGRAMGHPETDTVYLGGGTPTLLSESDLGRLTESLRTCFRLTDDCEITCECNPATADGPKLTSLRAMGVNRLSIGLQSVHDRELALLGRTHSFSDFQTVFLDARQAGFDNLSVDLMYGLPTQTENSFRESLLTLADMGPEHISAYGLKLEEGTPFYRERRTLPLPDEEEELRMYLLCSEILGEKGYRKYEISNFAKAGKESRHNLRYWQRRDYLGLGLAAHSCVGGVRFGNSRDLLAFLRGEDITEERTVLSEAEVDEEVLILSLRLAEGLSEEDFAARFGLPFEAFYPQISQRVEQGLLKREGGRVAFTDRGFFVSNAILTELLENLP